MEVVRHDHGDCSVRRRFESLWNHQALCDVTLITQEGTQMQAHFLYLAVHSAYFHQELSLYRKKASFNSSSATLHTDVPSCILRSVLEYIYKGELVITEDTIRELDKTAMKLKLEDVSELLKKSKYYHLLDAPDCSADNTGASGVQEHISGDSNWLSSDLATAQKQGSSLQDSKKNPCKYVSVAVATTNRLQRKLSPAGSRVSSNVEKKNGVSSSLAGSEGKAGLTGKSRGCSTVDLEPDRDTSVRRDKCQHGQLQRQETMPQGKESERSKLVLATSGALVRERRCRRVKDESTHEHGLRRSSRVRQRPQSLNFLNMSDTDENFDEETGFDCERGESSDQSFDSVKKQRTKFELTSVVDLPAEERHDSPILSTPKKQSQRKAKSAQLAVSAVKMSRKKSKVKNPKSTSVQSKRPTRCRQKPKKFENYYVIRERVAKNIRKDVPKRKKKEIPLPSLYRRVTYLSFQPLSEKICLQYRASMFTRHAFEECYSRCDHDYERTTWQCCGCTKNFSKYSQWRLHYRSCHLAYLLSKIAKIKILKLKKKCRRKRKRSCGTPMLMNCGKIRKMPGPKCTVSKTAMVRCIECGVMLASRASLKNHLLQYHNMDKQQVEQHQSLLVHCEVSGCAFANIDIQKVQRHVRESHPEIRHPCAQCQRSFVRQDLLDQHIRRIHQKLTKFVCSMCSEHFKKSCDQKIHEQQVHGINHNFVIYSCSVEGCNYQTITARYLDAHRKTRHFDNRIQCTYCTSKVKSKLALQMHVNALHLNKRPYLCEICGSGFCDPWTLQRHIAFRHSTARDYSCKHCHYECNNRIQFMNHTYQQHGERMEFDTRKEQTCPVCGYKALSTSRMNSHIRHIHADPHKYTCEICGKGFKNRHYLRDHQVIHSNSTYQCPHCDYSPWTSGKLKKHIRTQHIFKDVKPYSCNYCSFACSLSGNCRKHVIHKHPGLEVQYNTDKDMLAYMRKVEAELQTGKIKPTATKKSC